MNESHSSPSLSYGQHVWLNWYNGATMSMAAGRFFFHGLFPSWVDPPTFRPPQHPMITLTSDGYDIDDGNCSSSNDDDLIVFGRDHKNIL
jgi:hypothetical protein